MSPTSAVARFACLRCTRAHRICTIPVGRRTCTYCHSLRRKCSTGRGAHLPTVSIRSRIANIRAELLRILASVRTIEAMDEDIDPAEAPCPSVVVPALPSGVYPLTCAFPMFLWSRFFVCCSLYYRLPHCVVDLF